ncbi:hypothetical protein [Bradyrhizobium sp. ARR65]|uniref:hypothetical protein n=1 Tax=Bradyrhizobium sp. ARR65 TaxID=1040989 RepID=UPI000A812D46|nr:hypothetical protein [Bradyrhizobium sp. ARR65]
MTVTMYGSRKALPVNAPRGVNRTFLAQPFRFLAVPLYILVRYFLFLRIKTDPRRKFVRAESVAAGADCDRCNSRVRHLKQSIELLIEEVARLTCENWGSRQTNKLLSELTRELVTARLEACHNRDAQNGALMGSGTAQNVRERSAVYYPEQLSDLGQIFDEAVAALPEEMQTPASRTEIAKLILGRTGPSEIELRSLIKLIVAVATAV